MIINSQRTIYSIEYSQSKLFDAPYIPRINTTLNEKFNTLVNEPIGSDTTHTVKYLSIGSGGVPSVAGAGNYSFSEHGVEDAALFEHIPFVMRRTTNDINITEQLKYRLKVLINISGVDYYQYFLKRLSAGDITRGTYIITPGTGTTNVLTPFTTNASRYLNPVPSIRKYVAGATPTFISSMTKVRFNIPPTELLAITSAIDIMYGANSNKTITEIGICGGLDKNIGSIIEALEVQIYYHAGVNIDSRLTYDPIIGYDRAIEVGGSEPIYGY